MSVATQDSKAKNTSTVRGSAHDLLRRRMRRRTCSTGLSGVSLQEQLWSSHIKIQIDRETLKKNNAEDGASNPSQKLFCLLFEGLTLL